MSIHHNTGKVLVRMHGLNLDRVLNAIPNTLGKITNIHRIDSTNVQFCIRASILPKLIAKYDNSCYTIHIVRYYRHFDIIDILFRRFGLVLGILISTIILFVLNLFCLGYHINCQDDDLRMEIQSYLDTHNVVGSMHSSIDYHLLQSALVAEFDTLSLVDISRRGVYLIINTTIATPPNIPNTNTSGDIVASTDGVITRMHLVSGTALVSVGQTVHRGQTLIAGYYTDIFGNTVECEAEGTVYAKHWFSSTIDYPIHSIQYVPSGQYLMEQSILGPGINIPITPRVSPPEPCNIEYTYTYLTPALGFPLRLQTTYYHYLDCIEVDNDFEADKDAIIYEARELVYATCCDYEILDQKHTIALVGDIYFVTYYMCAEITIT
ncbi:MAG: sporulation protein YqfD [Clostridia bacterium]|nr:sporulation protein YqfD [Clostridia bacterium]